MMSIEMALIAISMAISATNCGFDKAGMPGASDVVVIGIFLAIVPGAETGSGIGNVFGADENAGASKEIEPKARLRSAFKNGNRVEATPANAPAITKICGRSDLASLKGAEICATCAYSQHRDQLVTANHIGFG
ncbi:hypothetical protein OE766_01395 [Pararhizobium sp. YC-54]|uniref:hypothetical protein n=1 Tax=Pararhizobium sp. YC-54 TaxID=2986920 RepID=UPI0021F7F638|nr:hypothetical protein [Pararhizobium sp. YC-54]MCV9996900.1 hypothetical protein [Pararhizobium sp. YC-54]